jgi:hypothetical protein
MAGLGGFGQSPPVLAQSAPVQWQWVNPLPTGNNLNGVAYGNGRYVAVGDQGTIETSTDDGRTWTAEPSGVTADLRAVVYGGGLFVAVGSGGVVLTSPDGVGWTVAQAPGAGADDLRAVAYGGGRFVAVGCHAAATSGDGVHWSTSEPFPCTALGGATGVAYGAGAWVVVGEAGYVSGDGQNWTAVSVPVYPDYGFAMRVVYGGGMFVAAGFAQAQVAVSTSPDGRTWSAPQLLGPGWPNQPMDPLTGLVWTGSFFLATQGNVGLAADLGAIERSADGVHWTQAAGPFPHALAAMACGADGSCVAVGVGGVLVAGMPQSTWLDWLLDFQINRLRNLQGTLFGVGDAIGTTADGGRWQWVSLPSGMDVAADVAWGGGRYVLAGWNETQGCPAVATSADGQNWAPVALPAGTPCGGSPFGALGPLTAVAYGLGEFVAVGGSGVLASADGQSWTVESVPAAAGQTVTDVVYAPDKGLFLATTTGGVLLSADGQQWRAPTGSPAPSGGDAAAYGEGEFAVLDGVHNLLWASADGDNWQSVPLPAGLTGLSSGYHPLAFLPGMGFAVARPVGGGPIGLTLGVWPDPLHTGASSLVSIPVGQSWVTSIAASVDGTPLLSVSRPVGISGPPEVVRSQLFPAFAAVANGVSYGPLCGVASGAGRVVAFGCGQESLIGGQPVDVQHDNVTLLSQDNGLHWSAVGSPPPGVGSVTDVVYGPAGFVAAGGGSTLLVSPDGTSWSSVTLATYEFDYLTVGNGLYLGTGWDVVARNPVVLRSADGLHWSVSPFAAAGSTGAYELPAFGGGLWVAVDANYQVGTSGVWTSPDGVQWQRVAQLPNLRASGITYASGRFVVVGDGPGGFVAYSSADGRSWTAANVQQPGCGSACPPSALVTRGASRTLAVAAGMLLALDPSTPPMASLDGGLSWVPALPPSDQPLTGLAAVSDGVVAIGTNGAILRAVPQAPSAAPIIAGLSPASGPVGTALTLTGSGFGTVAGTVYFTEGQATLSAPPLSWSDTAIRVAVPAGLAPGSVAVQVYGAGGLASNAVSFEVTAAAARLAFTVQPPAWVAGGLPAVQVAVEDGQGNVVPAASDTIRLSLVPAGGGAPVPALQGAIQVAATGGVATFPGLAVASGLLSPGVLYQLLAQDLSNPLPPAASAPFEPLTATLVVANQGESGAVWDAPVPAPGQGSGLGPGAVFAQVQFLLPYIPGDHLLLAGDAQGSQGFCVTGAWELDLSGPAQRTVQGQGCSGQPQDVLAGQLLPQGQYGAQLILRTPGTGGNYGASPIYLLASGATQFWPVVGAAATQPFVLVQPAPLAVGQAGDLDLIFAPNLPLGSLRSLAAALGWQLDQLSVQAAFPPGTPGQVTNGSTGSFVSVGLANPPGAGQAVMVLHVVCLQPGQWGITLSGQAGIGHAVYPLNGILPVRCAAPAAAAPAGQLQIDAQDGSLHLTVTGNGVEAAAEAELQDAGGTTVATATYLASPAPGEVLLRFPAVVPGAYTVLLRDAAGRPLTTVGALQVPDAAPVLVAEPAAVGGVVPGYASTHLWRVRNLGLVDGEAVVRFTFPGYMAPPAFAANLSTPGAQVLQPPTTNAAGGQTVYEAVAAVPVPAGGQSYLAWSVTLPPAAAFGSGAPAPVGATVAEEAEVTGSFSAAEWPQDAGLLGPPDWSVPVNASATLQAGDVSATANGLVATIQAQDASGSGQFQVQFTLTPASGPADPTAQETQLQGSWAMQGQLAGPGSGWLQRLWQIFSKLKEWWNRFTGGRDLYQERKQSVTELEVTHWLVAQGCLTVQDDKATIDALEGLAKAEFAVQVIDKTVGDKLGPEWQLVPASVQGSWGSRLWVENARGNLTFEDHWMRCFPDDRNDLTRDQLLNMILQKYKATQQHTSAVPVQAAYDPNRLDAYPQGAGASGWMTPQPLTYVIHFENEAKATAPAQNIRVVLQLDPSLDPATVAPGPSSFAGTEFTFDPASGTVSWWLPGINLPPNTTPPNGEGWVSFTVRPKAALPTGTQILASAQVFFDYNPPVQTATVVRTIDATPPSVTVQALPATVPAGPVQVSWQGQSAAGIASYTVFLSQDGGPLVPADTTSATSDTLYLQAGHTYGVAVQAVDVAGLASPLPTAPQIQFQSVAPALPLPAVSGPIQGPSVGPAGGILLSPDGLFRLAVPGGVLSGGSALWLGEAAGSAPPVAGAAPLPAGLQPASPFFVLSGAALQTPQPAVVRYAAAALGGLHPQRVALWELGPDGRWRALPTRVDPAAGTATAAAQAPGVVVAAVATTSFSDLPAEGWATPSVETLLAEGLVAGFPDGTFRPDDPVTRAQFTKLLVLALGLGPGGGPVPFGDVPPDGWYAPYVAAAVQAGLVQGLSSGSFGPDRPLTREQMAVLLARALQLNGGTNLAFRDAVGIDPWAQAAVQAAVAAGYLRGFPDGSFRPLEAATRAQAAQVLASVLAQRVPH